MGKEKLSWIKYEIRPVAEVDSSTGEETPISSDVVYINDGEFDEICCNTYLGRIIRSK
jgi:hypothetical protein